VFQEPDRVVSPSSWLEHIPFAFWLVDALRPALLVELGTQSGNSYAAFAQAVQRLGLSTTCYAVDTWLGDAQSGFYDEKVFTEWAAYHDRHFSAFSRLIRSTFADAAVRFSDGSVDLLHMDGCHTYEAVSADYELWRPRMSRGGVILIHDINVRERDFGAWRLWEELKRQSPSFTFLHGHGLGVLAAGTEFPEPLRWLFSRASTDLDDVSAVRQFFAHIGGVVSARFAVDERNAGAANLADQLGRERQEHDDATRRQWQVAAQLQEVVRDELERRRRVEGERDELREAAAAVSAELAAQRSRLTAELTAERSRLTDALTVLRDRLAIVEGDLEGKSIQEAEHSQQILSLERQLDRERMEHAEALSRKTWVAAELHQRLSEESARRRELEADRSHAAPPRRFLHPWRERVSRLRLAVRRSVRYSRRVAGIPSALGLGLSARRRSYRSVFALLGQPRRLRDGFVIGANGLFDEAYYRRRYPDVAGSRLAPLAHWVLKGAYEGRSPHPLFDCAFYLRTNPDVASTSVNPLYHYLTRGAFEGRSPHPLFDVVYYLSTNPDVRNARAEPLFHFVTSGGREGRNPSTFFDCLYYLRMYPDVAESGTNPLVHYLLDGWREGRMPSAVFDSRYYLSHNPDVERRGDNPLTHYVEYGRFEGRPAVDRHDEEPSPAAGDEIEVPPLTLKVRSRDVPHEGRSTVLCLSHVIPCPPRAGNEYRIYRLLRWLQHQGYRIVPVIAPLPGASVPANAIDAVADEFSNAVICHRDGRVDYHLPDVPDVLASLNGELTRPISLLLDENAGETAHARQLLQMDRVFCHDVLITTALRLHQVLGPHVLLAEYIWMSRIFPLVPSGIPKVVDTIDVFSTKREKVVQFGIDDLHVERHEEVKRLRHADLVVAIQDEERLALERLLPDQQVVTAGVDFDVVEDAGIPVGQRVLYVASDNPMNRKGLVDFLRFAWPYVRRQAPDAELLVAGRVSDALHLDEAGVIRLGPVEDLENLYRQARVVINPAVAGTGLKIKTLEALSYLRPIITWPNGTDGLARELTPYCTTVHDWFEFSRRLADLLAAPNPFSFSRADRDTIVRVASPAATYGVMTDAIHGLLKARRHVTERSR
jgi:hypothetical protein